MAIEAKARTEVGTRAQVETAREVLARLSAERVGDGELRDAIGLVRNELFDVLYGE